MIGTVEEAGRESPAGPARRFAEGGVATALRTAALLLALAVPACASFDVRIEFDPDEDFSALRTFDWYPRATPPGDSDTVRFPDLWNAMKPTIEKNLEQKGYTRAAGGQADFLVNYHLSMERRLDTRTINAPYGGPGRSEWEVHRTVRETLTVEYDVGTLVIDVLDVGRRSLVWRGTVSRRLDRDPDRSQIEQSCSQILARFPPPGQSGD